MALTINPAVGRVGYRRWILHVVLFVAGTAAGALVTYGITRVLYVALEHISPIAWLVVATPVLALAVLRDLGLPAPVPYPARRQVPEWLRRVLPPGLTALAYGSQLGTGFLTRFTYSTHTAFVALLATEPPNLIVLVAVMAFALAKAVVVASSLAGRSYPEFEQRLLRRQRLRGQATLRTTNAALAAAAAAVLITTF